MKRDCHAVFQAGSAYCFFKTLQYFTAADGCPGVSSCLAGALKFGRPDRLNMPERTRKGNDLLMSAQLAGYFSPDGVNHSPRSRHIFGFFSIAFVLFEKQVYPPFSLQLK